MKPANVTTPTRSLAVILQMLFELCEIVALQRVFRDIVPNRLGFVRRYLVIVGSQGKNEVIGVMIFRVVEVQLKTVNVFRLGSG